MTFALFDASQTTDPDGWFASSGPSLTDIAPWKGRNVQTSSDGGLNVTVDRDSDGNPYTAGQAISQAEAATGQSRASGRQVEVRRKPSPPTRRPIRWLDPRR